MSSNYDSYMNIRKLEKEMEEHLAMKTVIEIVKKKNTTRGAYQTAQMTPGQNSTDQSSKNVNCYYICFCKTQFAKANPQQCHKNKNRGCY